MRQIEKHQSHLLHSPPLLSNIPLRQPSFPSSDSSSLPSVKESKEQPRVTLSKYRLLNSAGGPDDDTFLSKFSDSILTSPSPLYCPIEEISSVDADTTCGQKQITIPSTIDFSRPSRDESVVSLLNLSSLYPRAQDVVLDKNYNLPSSSQDDYTPIVIEAKRNLDDIAITPPREISSRAECTLPR